MRGAGGRVTLLCMGVGLVLACGHTPSSERAATRAVTQPLVSQPALYVGTSLPTKHVVLTFDDGPGPLSVTGALSTWLKSRPVPIRATFFVNGACIAATTMAPNQSCPAPVASAAAILAQLTSDGHLVANHTTTHRDLVTEVPDSERVQELAETDGLIAPYVPWNRFLFRAPFGSWTTASAPTPYETLTSSTMAKYVGPVHWDIGGGPTDESPSATKAVDLECWQLGYTTRQCGDRYLAETRALTKGIIRLHDPSGDTSNHDIDTGTGNTVDLVQYIVPVFEGEGFTFRALDEVPVIAAALPTCDASCLTCSGVGPAACTSCDAGKYLSGGACSTCSACGAGSFQASACSSTADTTCGTCHASCSACTGPDVDDCTTCPSEFYSSGGTCHACSACAAGSFRAAPCSANADTICVLCPRGTFSTDNAETCAACDDGTFASTAGSTECTSCLCDDDDPCTSDTCSPTVGCTHAAVDGCTPGPGEIVEAPALDASPSRVVGAGDSPRDQGCHAGATVPRGAASFSVALATLSLALLRRLRRRREAATIDGRDGRVHRHDR